MTKTTKPKIRRPYDASPGTSITFTENTKAQQSFQDECDINTIMSRYQQNGVLDHVQSIEGAYGDFSNVVDYQLGLNQILAAQDAFDQLPAKLRERFRNDPAELMTFLQDEKNRAEAEDLGLVEKKSEGAPPPPPAGTPPASPPAPEGGA